MITSGHHRRHRPRRYQGSSARWSASRRENRPGASFFILASGRVGAARHHVCVESADRAPPAVAQARIEHFHAMPRWRARPFRLIHARPAGQQRSPPRAEDRREYFVLPKLFIACFSGGAISTCHSPTPGCRRAASAMRQRAADAVGQEAAMRLHEAQPSAHDTASRAGRRQPTETTLFFFGEAFYRRFNGFAYTHKMRISQIHSA